MTRSSEALDVFRRLTSVPTAPFFEEAVAEKALAWARSELGSRVKTRRSRGGWELRYTGAGPGPALVLAAHLDHPAFKLRKCGPRDAEGLLQGGLPAHILPGCRVQAFAAGARTNVPLAYGRLAASKDGGVFPIEWESAPKKRPDFAILDLPACRVRDGWLESRSIDDLLGCAVSMAALRRLVVSKAKCNAVVLLHRAEEVGFIGALDLIAQGKVDLGDSVISVESSRAMPGARPGHGAVVRLGDKACAFDPNVTALLDEAAAAVRKRGVRVQRKRLTGGTCEATAYLAFGYEAGGVAVPLVNYHNGWGAKAVAPEKIRMADVDSAVALLEEACRRFPKATLRGQLRKRLGRRLKDYAPSLARP